MDGALDTTSIRRMAAAGRDYRLALFLLAASGAAALGHQFLWTRRLTDLLGATSESNMRVLSGFFLGLAMGAAAAAWALPKLRRPWRVIALVELGIAFLSLPILYLTEWAPWVWSALGPEGLANGRRTAIKLALSYLLIVPPAFLMGTTVPLMVAAVCHGQKNADVKGVWLYSLNTLGGVVGLAIVVGFGLHTFGMTGAMLLTMGINAAIACICLVQHFQSKNESLFEAFDAGSTSVGTETAPFRWMLWASFCSGAGIMALEMLGLRLMNLSALLSFYHPLAILVCVILILAVASGVVPLLTRRFGGVTRLLPLALAAAGLFAVLVPVLFMRQAAGGASVHYTSNLGGFLWRLFGLTLTSLGPALVFAGLVFPMCVMGCGGHGFSRRLGAILAFNGIGGLLGAEISLRLLLPVFGVHKAIGVVACFYSALSLVFGLRFKPGSRMALQFILIASVLTGFMFMHTLPRLPVFGKSDIKTIEVQSGYEGTLAVVEGEQFGRALVFDNQYMLGSSRAAPDLERQTHIPLLLHPRPEKIGFLGLGTGITASGALKHGPVKSITVVELSPLVAQAAALHFSEFNNNICTRNNVSVLVEDARAHLAVSHQSYDVIIGDLFTPWRPGEASLCELELFQAARAALRSGGIYCQWIPMHQLTPAQFEVIARTFQKVFPDARLFRNHFKTRGLPLALIGFKDSRLDWAVVSQRCASECRYGQLFDPICRHPEGLAMLYLGRLNGLTSVTGKVNTRKNLWLELDAGQKWILGRKEEYYSGSGELWLKLLQNQVDGSLGNSDLPDSLNPWPGTGLLLSKYEIATEQDLSTALRIYSQLKAQLPDSFLSDAAADWALWPGSQSPHPHRNDTP